MNTANVRFIVFLLPTVAIGCGDGSVSTGVIEEVGTTWVHPASTGWGESSSTSEPLGRSSSPTTGGEHPPDDPTDPTDPTDPWGTTTGGGSSSSTSGPPDDPGTCEDGVDADALCEALAQPHGDCESPPLFTELQCEMKFADAPDAACREAVLRELLCFTVAACDPAPEDTCAAEINAYDLAC